MKQFLINLISRVKSLWQRWSFLQRIVFLSLAVALVAALVIVGQITTTPSLVALFSSPLADPLTIENISRRLDREGVAHSVDASGLIYVADEFTAQRMVALLFREDLIPADSAPYDIFRMDPWTITDMERQVNLQQAITANLEQHIMRLDDIDSVSVTLVIPDRELFAADQDPTSATVVIAPRPGSDIVGNREKITGIEKMVQFAVPGLTADFIQIQNTAGEVLNDLAANSGDDLVVAQKQLREKQRLENSYKNQIYQELATIYTPDRIRIIKVDINLDMSKKIELIEQVNPIEMSPDNPDTPYDERQVVENIPISTESETINFVGNGLAPGGPPGTDSMSPPGYREVENMQGKYDQDSSKTNYAVSTATTNIESQPWEIKQVSLSVVIDGIWQRVYDDTGSLVIDPNGSIQREFTPVSSEEITRVRNVVEGAINYSTNRGDTVIVEPMQFDRSAQFELEDDLYRSEQTRNAIIFWSAIAVAAIVLLFSIARFIIKERERRRRQQEEEIARKHAAMREAALRSAEEESIGLNVSIEDQERNELVQEVIDMVRDNPEDVVLLLRTWMQEE